MNQSARRLSGETVKCSEGCCDIPVEALSSAAYEVPKEERPSRPRLVRNPSVRRPSTVKHGHTRESITRILAESETPLKPGEIFMRGRALFPSVGAVYSEISCMGKLGLVQKVHPSAWRLVHP